MRREPARQSRPTPWSARDGLPGIGTVRRHLAPGTLVDRLQEVHWTAPAIMTLTVSVAPAGTPPTDGHVRRMVHNFTPETAVTSHYWFALAYPLDLPDGADLAEKGVSGLAVPFETEDLPMLEAQQAVIGSADFEKMRPAMMRSDAGATLARRTMKRLIAAEQRAG